MSSKKWTVAGIIVGSLCVLSGIILGDFAYTCMSVAYCFSQVQIYLLKSEVSNEL